MGEVDANIMKTAIYIEDGVVQLVLTPENEFEKNSLTSFKPKSGYGVEASRVEAEIFEGTFYDCRGGWVRQKAYYGHSQYGENSDDCSLIIRNVSAPTPSPDLAEGGASAHP